MSITPYLYYESVEDAMEFLAKAFGFRKSGEPMTGPDGKISHAAMKLGEDVVMMGHPGPHYKSPKRLKHSTHSLYVETKGVDKLFERARKAEAKVLEEPVDTAYGHRRFGVEDPEGQQWYFAEEIKKPS